MNLITEKNKDINITSYYIDDNMANEETRTYDNMFVVRL